MSIKDKLMTISENMPKVYESGVAQGKQDEYDAFWDIFQDYGNRNSYYNTFQGSVNTDYWKDAIFNPKYELDCSGNATYSARSVFSNNIRITDIKVPMNCQGVSMRETFNTARALIRIPLIRVNADTSFLTAFKDCDSLEEVKFEGVIAKNGLDLQYSPKLSKASITSVINALSTTTSGLSVTLSKTAVTTAFGSTDSEEWLALIATKQNWTINLS